MKTLVTIIAALILTNCSKSTSPDDLLNPVSTVVKQVIKGTVNK